MGLDCFPMLLKAGHKYFPNELGFFFKKDSTVSTLAFKEFGREETLKNTSRPAPTIPSCSHHVIQHAPQFGVKDFAARYPAAIFLRDENQRTLHQVALSSQRCIKVRR